MLHDALFNAMNLPSCFLDILISLNHYSAVLLIFIFSCSRISVFHCLVLIFGIVGSDECLKVQRVEQGCCDSHKIYPSVISLVQLLPDFPDLKLEHIL
jgi:hypothetical protein